MLPSGTPCEKPGIEPVTEYDAIVIGVGGMGSAALYHLAQRRQKVLGLERYDIPNEMG